VHVDPAFVPAAVPVNGEFNRLVELQRCAPLKMEQRFVT
jgi:hypothetical protein